MVPDFLEFALGLYFFGFMFILIPALGLVTGAVTGRPTPGVGIAVVTLVGLASGVVGLVLAIFVGLIANWIMDHWLVYLVALVLPLGGAVAPVPILQLVPLWRRC